MNLTQHVQTLASYDEFSLPYEITFNEFTNEAHVMEHLVNSIARQQCASQHMDQNRIQPREVTENVLDLIDTIKLNLQPYSRAYELSSQLTALLEAELI